MIFPIASPNTVFSSDPDGYGSLNISDPAVSLGVLIERVAATGLLLQLHRSCCSREGYLSGTKNSRGSGTSLLWFSQAPKLAGEVPGNASCAINLGKAAPSLTEGGTDSRTPGAVSGDWSLGAIRSRGFHNLIPLGMVWGYHVGNDMAVVWNPKMKSPEHENYNKIFTVDLFHVRKKAHGSFSMLVTYDI